MNNLIPFGDIVHHIGERVDPAETDLEIYVGLEHLDSESLKIRRHGHPSDVKGTKLRFYEGDIIFGKRRYYQKKLAVADFEGICSAHAMVLRAKTDVVLPEFLPFFMQSETFFNLAMSISVGSLSPTINWGTLKKQKFTLPPLDEQRRIAEILWAVEDVINKWNLVYHKLDVARRVISSEYFSNRDKSYETAVLSDLTSKIGSGKTPRGGSKVYTEEGVLFLRSQNIYADGLHLEDVARIPNHIDEDMSSTRVQHRDVLLNITGASIGRCTLYKSDEPANVNQHVCIIRSKNDQIVPEYLTYYIQSSYGQRQVYIYSTNGNREGLNFQQLGGFQIPLPNIDEQWEIVSDLEKIHSQQKTIVGHIENTELLKKIMIQDMIG